MIEYLRILLDRRQRWRMALLLAGLLLAGLLEMVSIGSIPAFVGLLVSPERILVLLPEGSLSTRLAAVEPTSLVLAGAVALAGLFIGKNLYLVALINVAQRLVRGVSISVATRLFRAYLYSPYTFHLQHNPARLIRNTTYDSTQAVLVLAGAMRVAREGLVLLVIFFLLLAIDPVVSLAVFLLLGTTAAGFHLLVRKQLSAHGQLVRNHTARQLKAVNQGLGSIKDAKILGREPAILAQFADETRSIHQHQHYQRVMEELPRLFLETIAIGVVLVVSVVFLLLGRPFQEMLPVLSLLAVAVVRLVPAFNVISWGLSNIRFLFPCLESVCRELSELEKHLPSDLATTATAVIPLRQTITLKNLSFRYPNTGHDALHDISLQIRAGEAVAFIGPSGSGKSTLVDVILGLLPPAAGEVLVDGGDIHENLAAWQRQIGYIPQDIYLLDDSIRRNIAFGLPDNEIDENAVRKAIRAAQLEEFIATLPQGPDTVIGNRGIRLSGGQRQRVGIARALYHNPRVLVMDEATSALDNETEREVIKAINHLRGERTIITVAHRLTTVEECDRVYSLEGGRIRGTTT